MLREYVVGQRVFNVEILMYTKIRTTLETLLQSRTGSDIKLPFATYYDGVCDGLNDCLCLEDLRPEGYVMPDKYKGLNFQQADLTMKELAKFHAYTYFFIRQTGESFFDDENLKQYAKAGWLEPEFIGLMHEMFGGAMRAALNVLEKHDPELTEKFRTAVKDTPNIVKNAITTISRTDTLYFPIICHGDFWCNNILFKYENGSVDETKPIGIKFVDFQQSHRGNIYEELLYFIFTSTTPEFRKEYLTRVLDSYYESFTGTLDELKFPKPINFTKGFFIDHFYEGYFPILCFLPYAIPLQLGAPPEPHNSKQTETAEDQMKSMSKDFETKWEGSPRAIQRMLSILREFADLKLL